MYRAPPKPGIQVKTSSESGSYLVTLMTGMLTNNGDNKNYLRKFKFFEEILGKMRHDLHEKGKQQVTFSFNNHTLISYIIQGYRSEIQECR